MKFLLGTKKEMTQIYDEEGQVHPVTKIVAGPCVVTQVKTTEQDGYGAVQLGFGEQKEHRVAKPQKAHLKGLKTVRAMREFRVENTGDFERGAEVKADIFEAGEKIHVTGTSKGKGFQGVVKRWGFHGSPKSHGHKDQLRMPGSIGDTGAQIVKKGKKMGGRMGGDRVTEKNLKIIKVDLEQNLLYVEGAVPGAQGGLLLIKSV